MSYLSNRPFPDWSGIHDCKTFTPWSLVLAPLSLMYGLGVRLRLRTVQKTTKKTLPGFVVSVGNLTAGGTGKTPAVHMLAAWAREEGLRAAVLSRGYGGRSGKEVVEVSDGRSIRVGCGVAGDEPLLLAEKMRNIPVVVARDRYRAGLLAHQRHGCNFFILDDGYQHHALKRDLDLVLLDAANPFGNGHLLPWGPLREPISRLERAHAFILTRSSQGRPGENLFAMLRERFPNKPVFRSEHRPESVVFPESNRVLQPGFLFGKRVLAFAGIARPGEFIKTLTDLGAEVLSFRPFMDHHRFTGQELRDLIRCRETLGADFMITTEKDWIRIRDLLPANADPVFLTITFKISSNTDAFFRLIRDAAGDLKK